jgi:hypothetical protein
MQKLTNNHSLKLLVAIALGLLFASTFTSIQTPCSTTIPGEETQKCIEWSKVVMRPDELLSNSQSSLVRFSVTFFVISLSSYALLSIYNRQLIKRSG